VKQSLPMISSTSVTTSRQKETGENQQLSELRIKKYRLYLKKDLKKILISWFHCCRWVYNKCVHWVNINPEAKVTLKALRDYTINSKTIDYEPNVMDFLSKVPYDVKDSAIRDFYKALATQTKMVKEGKRKFFKMKFRSKRDIQSLGIPHKFLKLEGQDIKCFPKFLGRSEEHTSELQSPVPSSYAVFCLKKKKSTPIEKRLSSNIRAYT